MFERLMEAAERTATAVSRRQFLGRLGQSALATVAAVGGLAAFAAGAAGAPVTVVCSIYSDSQCANKPVGSHCYGLDGRTIVRGKCVLINNGYGGCGCVANARKYN